MTRYFAEPGLRAIGRYTKLPAFGDLAAGRRTTNPTLIARASVVDGLSASMMLDLDARFGVTLVGQDVSNWEDGIGAANDFLEGTNRPVYTAAHADWGGLPNIRYTAANTDRLVSVDAASTWTFLHNGSGSALGFVVRRQEAGIGNFYRLASTANNSSNVGLWAFFGSADGVGATVVNGTASLFAVSSLPFDTGQRLSVVVTYSSTAPLAVYANGVLVASNASAYTPSAAAPTSTLRIGVGSDGSLSPYDGDINAVHAWTRYFSASDAARYHHWAATNWNL